MKYKHLYNYTGFIKGRAQDKMTICEHDFAHLLLISCLSFPIKEHIQVTYPGQLY